LTGVQLVHVPYKATAQGILAVMTGEVDMGFFNTPTVISQVAGGKLKPLGVTSLARSPLLPSVPTLDEQGIKGFEMTTWFGFIGPARLPAPIVERLNKEINAILAAPALQQKLAQQGFERVPPGTPDDFAKVIRADLAKWVPLIKAAGARAD
ncbi:MAG: tripartite tricarboxylate transporter substrate binding protein, partial [Betaproteobacteria bacterium]|nr:tripartite tricarboxylate transporter substrate binding protein [Betaproteobacteria bacterium]